MIDITKVSSDMPDFKYDTSELKAEGYKFKAAYDFENPDFENELTDIKIAGKEFRIVQGNGRQKDIWVR